jgi:hypothetical protein
MSQFDFGTIDPYVVDGVQLADMLNQWRDAIHSWHRGASRPTYVTPGMMWINDAGGATNWIVNVYLSPTVGDVAMFTYNTSTGAITLAAAAGGTFAAAVLLAQANANPQVQWNATGNPIDAKAWRATVNAAGALVLSSYNDAGAVIASITFNRDGSISSPLPLMRMVGEQVLVANATEMRVNIPAATKAIELWFGMFNLANANDLPILQGLNGATPITSNNHFIQYFAGSGATPAANAIGPSTGWQLSGGVGQAVGTIRLVLNPTGGVTYGKADFWALAGAARISVNTSLDGSSGAPTGFRLYTQAAVNLIAGSFLRAFAAV